MIFIALSAALAAGCGDEETSLTTTSSGGGDRAAGITPGETRSTPVASAASPPVERAPAIEQQLGADPAWANVRP